MCIPETKREAVDRALMGAFHCNDLDTISRLSGGLSGAAIFKIRVGGVAYLLRIEGARDAFRDPHRSYACMGIAAEAMLAPRVRYADPADGVAIMDFIPEQSLALDYAGTRAELIVEAAQTLRALHQAPAFPPLVDYMDGMDAVLGALATCGLLNPAATDELFARYAPLRAAWRTDPADLVASHNDLNPRNILYDGRRLWLVDWESAFLADRHVDLACLANVFTHDAAEEDLLLRTYFGRAPDGRRRAGLGRRRRFNHLLYGGVILSGAGADRPGGRLPQIDLAGPALADLHAAIGLGEFALDPWEGRVTYGRSRLAAALAGLRAPDFAEALDLAA